MFSTLHTHTHTLAWTSEQDPSAEESPTGDFDHTPLPSNRPSLSMMRRSEGDGWLSANHDSKEHLKAEPKGAAEAPGASPSTLHGDYLLPGRRDFTETFKALASPANDLTDRLIPPRSSSIQVQKATAKRPSSSLPPAAQVRQTTFQHAGQGFVVNTLNGQYEISPTLHSMSNGAEFPTWNHNSGSQTANSPWQDGPFSPNPPSSDIDLPIPMSKVRPAPSHTLSSTKPFSASDSSLAPRQLGDYIPPASLLPKVSAIPAEPQELTAEEGDQECRIDSFSTVGSHEGHHHTAAFKPVREQQLHDVTQLYPEPVPQHSLAECDEYPIYPDQTNIPVSDAALPVSNSGLGPNPIGQRSLSLGSLLDYGRTSQ